MVNKAPKNATVVKEAKAKAEEQIVAATIGSGCIPAYICASGIYNKNMKGVIFFQTTKAHKADAINKHGVTIQFGDGDQKKICGCDEVLSNADMKKSRVRASADSKQWVEAYRKAGLIIISIDINILVKSKMLKYLFDALCQKKGKKTYLLSAMNGQAHVIRDKIYQGLLQAAQAKGESKFLKENWNKTIILQLSSIDCIVKTSSSNSLTSFKAQEFVPWDLPDNPEILKYFNQSLVRIWKCIDDKILLKIVANAFHAICSNFGWRHGGWYFHLTFRDYFNTIKPILNKIIDVLSAVSKSISKAQIRAHFDDVVKFYLDTPDNITRTGRFMPLKLCDGERLVMLAFFFLMALPNDKEAYTMAVGFIADGLLNDIYSDKYAPKLQKMLNISDFKESSVFRVLQHYTHSPDITPECQIADHIMDYIGQEEATQDHEVIVLSIFSKSLSDNYSETSYKLAKDISQRVRELHETRPSIELRLQYTIEQLIEHHGLKPEKGQPYNIKNCDMKLFQEEVAQVRKAYPAEFSSYTNSLVAPILADAKQVKLINSSSTLGPEDQSISPSSESSRQKSPSSPNKKQRRCLSGLKCVTM